MTITALSARETAERVNAGTLSAETIVAAFAERIAEREPAVEAWTFFDATRAFAEAKTAPAGPLAGVTFGVKDVIDTADMPTGYGSAAYAGARPVADAPCVALLRAAGGVALGKTVSTEFAMSSPGKTRNPFDPGRTPGGSSSGSAAAVAAGMTHAAFGTQTSGSLIRPSSYCGVVGYKPSFGTLNRAGIKVLSDSLDTLGVVTRTVDDAAYVTAVLASRPTLGRMAPAVAPRVGVFRGSRWSAAEPATRQAIERAAGAFAAAGAVVSEVAAPEWFDRLYAWQEAVMGWETPQALAHEWLRLSDQLAAGTIEFIRRMQGVTVGEYDAAQAAVRDKAALLDELLGDCDVLLTPSATGEAPEGLGATGDPVFNRAWTLLHGPCINLPAGRGPAGMPVGVQLVARLGDDAGLLSVAAFAEAALAGGSAR